MQKPRRPSRRLSRRLYRRPSRPLRKTPRFDDLADDEPESSSDSISSESSEDSPPPDFAADADDEEGYESALEGTPSPKPQPKRPSRLAKPRCFLDAVRPYVEPMSRDAIKLSQLTMAQITAGEAYRGPLVVTEADRAEEEAARTTAAMLARYDSDEFIDDREEVIPQVQTRPFSLKKRTRSENSNLSSSDSEPLSGESGSERRSELAADDSPLGNTQTEESPASHYDNDEPQATQTDSSDYESKEARSPPKMVLRLVRGDRIASGKRSKGSDSESCDNHEEALTKYAVDESSYTPDQASKRSIRESEAHGLSELEYQTSKQRHSMRPAPVAPSCVIDAVDSFQDGSTGIRIQRPQRRTVRSRSGMRSSTSNRESATVAPLHTAPSQILDVIDLCDDNHEDKGRKEALRQRESQVVDLCSDDGAGEVTTQPTHPRRSLRTTRQPMRYGLP